MEKQHRPPQASWKVFDGRWGHLLNTDVRCAEEEELPVAEADRIKDLMRNQPIQVSKTRWDVKRGSLCHCETALSSLKSFGGQGRLPVTGGRQTLHHL